jgi:hypothetical protein
MLDPIADDVWALARPQSFLGLQLGTRMTVVRLSDGGLFIHSPVAPDDELRRALDALGDVRHVVAPNLYHHLHVGAFAAAYPNAELHGAPGLAKKRKDLRFATLLGDEPEPGWAADLRQMSIRGSLFGETVFFHERSRTLIVADLVESYSRCEHGPTRAFLRMTGVYGGPAVARQHKLAYRDKVVSRAAVDRVLEWGIDRIVPCHGDPIATAASTVLRDCFAWLRPRTVLVPNGSPK